MINKFLVAILSFSCFTSFNNSANNVESDFKDKIVYNLNTSHDLELTDNEELEECSMVQIVLQYESSFKCNHIDLENDFDLINHRNELREHYTEINAQKISDLNLLNYKDVYASLYGPFITYSYDANNDSFMNDLELLEEIDDDELLKIYVESNDNSDFATRNSSTSFYQFSDALNDVGIPESCSFTGDGIKIGSIESGIPNNYINLNETTYETYGAYQTDHAFYTSSVYGGSSGIAKDVDIYFSALTNYTFSECVDWLLLKGVNIINRSNGAKTGTYNSNSAYADYIVKETKITFINSAGNDGDANIIGNPSTGVNVISVASNDSNLGISSFSSAGLASSETNLLLKPTITAPGGNLYGVENISSALNGTSFSAPMVTGVVALLMEEFPNLKYHPEAVMNVLCNSATFALGQTDEVDYDAGFGIVNYERARKACENIVNQTLTSAVTDNQEIYQKNIVLNNSETINLQTTTLFNSNANDTSYSVNLSEIDFSNFIIQIYDLATNEVVYTSSQKSNMSYISFTNPYATSKTYGISVKLSGSKYGTSIEYYSINYFLSNEFTVDLEIIAGNKVDVSPTFSWSENSSKKFSIVNEYGLVFFDGNKNEIDRVEGISTTKYTLPVDLWENIISSSGSTYYVSIIGKSSSFISLNSYYSNLVNFTKPTEFAEKYILYPSSYQFPESYNVTTPTTITLNDLVITNERLRCGYIEEQYINLSARKQSCGEAYLVYYTNKAISRIDVNLSFWSDSEYLSSTDSEAYIQYLDENGNWIVALDLLNDITLSTDKENQDTYSVMLGEGATTFRFYVKTRPIGTHNKGRISIGNMILYTIE